VRGLADTNSPNDAAPTLHNTVMKKYEKVTQKHNMALLDIVATLQGNAVCTFFLRSMLFVYYVMGG